MSLKTTKPLPADLTSSRRAQPPRQTRNNPPRSSVAGSRQFDSRGSLGGDGPSDQAVEIFPAITHFADAITALPKELVRHFTLLKEVDAKIFHPEEDLGRLVEAALNAPLPRRPAGAIHNVSGQIFEPTSAQGSVNGSVTNGHVGSVASIHSAADAYNPADAVWEPANMPRRQLFQHVAFTMTNMLVSLDEKNHVISTASEALNKQLARIDDCFPHIEMEISEEARYGSTTHWAYPENRVQKTGTGSNSRRDLGTVNHLTAAAQQLADEVAARSDARKQALLAKKNHNKHAESDFDDNHDARQREKKIHGNSKIRKPVDNSSGVGLGITNGVNTNGNAPKRRKVEKGPAGGAVMERALSGVFGTNGSASKKAGSPRETPPGDGPKKRQRNTANGQSRKRTNTVTSIAMSPSIASSPIRNTYPEIKPPGRATPPITNGAAKVAPAKGRQNSTQSIVENVTRISPPAPAKQNGNGVATPDLSAASSMTGRTITEIKALMKETGSNSKGEHLLEDVDHEEANMVGGIVVGSRSKEATKKEADNSAEPMQGIQSTTIITTKSGRASKPSTPAIPQFPEPVRSRSARNGLEATSSNKRSHKKGAGAAAQQQQQQLLALQGREEEDASSVQGDEEDDEINPDEPRYCYCNGVSYGEMVGCDSDTCEREWFHLECVGLKSAPSSKAKWYCDDCKDKLKAKRFNSR